MDNPNKTQLKSPMHINLNIEKPALFPLQFKHCTVQILAVVSRHRYFVHHGYIWFAVFGIENAGIEIAQILGK